METALWKLAEGAARGFDRDSSRFSPEVEGALDLFAVKIVLVDPVESGHQIRMLTRQHAEPVQRAEAGGAPKDDVLPVALAQSLGLKQTLFRDYDDELWGGALVVEAATAGRFVFPFPAESATVRVDGKPAAPLRAGPLVMLELPAGRPHVSVTHGTLGLRAWIPILAAAGLALGGIGFLVSIRPSAAELAEPESGRH
jgi:hypothetical protein